MTSTQHCLSICNTFSHVEIRLKPGFFKGEFDKLLMQHGINVWAPNLDCNSLR